MSLLQIVSVLAGLAIGLYVVWQQHVLRRALQQNLSGFRVTKGGKTLTVNVDGIEITHPRGAVTIGFHDGGEPSIRLHGPGYSSSSIRLAVVSGAPSLSVNSSTDGVTILPLGIAVTDATGQSTPIDLAALANDSK